MMYGKKVVQRARLRGFEETGTRQRVDRERVKGKEAERRLKVEPGRVRQVGPHVCVLLQFARRRRANVSCSQAGAAHRHDSRVREGLCVLGPPRPSPSPSPHSRTTLLARRDPAEAPAIQRSQYG